MSVIAAQIGDFYLCVPDLLAGNYFVHSYVYAELHAISTPKHIIYPLSTAASCVEPSRQRFYRHSAHSAGTLGAKLASLCKKHLCE